MAKSTNKFKTSIASSLQRTLSRTNYLGNAMEYGLSKLSNPKWDDFAKTGIRMKEALVRNSVAGSLINPDKNTVGGPVIGGRYNPYANALYASTDTEKSNRLYEYRLMASFPEVAKCLDEIGNNFIWEDERGNVVNFRYLDDDLPSEHVTDITEEFNKFSRYFNFKEKGKKYCLDFITDGELYIELIINNESEENKKRGVLGVQKLQTELMETVYKNKENGVVGIFLGKSVTYNEKPNRIVNIEHVPYHPNELFYVSSGTWDPTGEWIVPFIERGRKLYTQLSYLEDAIVIYRLVRAPERLIFDIDTGTLPPPEAEKYLNEVKRQYWKTKNFDISSNDINNKFEPQSMLDAFFIGRGAGQEKVDIKQLSGGQNLGELTDLNFFLEALYRALNVPVSYLKSDSSANVDSSQILREELNFARFIIDIQNKFAISLREAFVTHLKLTGKYKEYGLQENMMDITFVPPSHYFEMRKVQGIQIKANAFNTIAQIDGISRSWALKRVWGLSNAEIKQNIRLRKIDKIHDWEIAQIEAAGPFWEANTIKELSGAAGGEGGGDMGGDMGGGDFGDDFGGGMDDMGGDIGGDEGLDAGDMEEISADIEAADDVLS